MVSRVRYSSSRNAYSVGRVELESFMGEDRCVREFLGSKRANTSLNYGYVLCRFFKWLRVVKGLELGPEEFLNEHLKRRRNVDSSRLWARSLVVEYVRDNPDFEDMSDGRRRFLYCVIKSFFNYYDVPLTSSRGLIGKASRKKYRPRQMTVQVAKRVLGCVNQRDRAVLLVMLQSGMSIGDVLNKFNFMLREVEGCLKAGAERLRVDFQERKANGFSYFTFISRDALHELAKWLALRKKWLGSREDPGAIFIGKKACKPLTVDQFTALYRYRLRRAGLKQGPFSLRAHMFRKLFKTEASIPERGVDKDVVEFMMGHLSGIESVGGVYDKTPEIHEAVIEREYMKLEPYINIYSGKTAESGDWGISQEDVESLKLLLQMFKQGKVKISL